MKLKKLLISVIILSTFLFSYMIFFETVYAIENDTLNITAQSAILIDNRTNKILYDKNKDKKMYPASTTKIVTAILTLDHAELNEVVTASYDAIMSIPNGYSTVDIQIGEQFTVEQLLELLLVHSANDAANVLAEYVGGSVDSFVSMMNTKVNELGLTNTNFTNTYGKHDDNHYTTAYDLAKLMQYCIKNDTFRRISSMASCAIPATNNHNERLYSSTNELIIPTGKYYYSYLIAGKTGFTTQAGNCLVSASYNDNLELTAVVLGCPINTDNRFTDSRALYEYGYSNYSVLNIAKENDVATQIEISNATKSTKNLDLLLKENIPVLISNSNINNEVVPQIYLNETLSAPIEEGDVLGKITYSVEGVEYTTDLVSSHFVEPSHFLEYLIYIFGGILLILLLTTIINSKKK